MCFVQWCNENSGFLSALLSAIGLFLSSFAICVSVHTARLPYKKNILLSSSLTYRATNPNGVNLTVIGSCAHATNVGNRPVCITYLGYAVKIDGTMRSIISLYRKPEEKTISQAEILHAQFSSEELLRFFSNKSKTEKLYIYATDTEGKVYTKLIGNVDDMVVSLSD